MNKLVIIDGNSLINRAYYAIQRPMMTKEGIYTQGIYGFLSMLSKIRSDYEPTHMLVAFDRKAPTFRHKEYSDYKAGRKKMPDELAMQLPILKDILHAMGISTYEIDGFEADDILGTTASMAEKEQLQTYIITGDKDALQLATNLTSIIITKKGISEFKMYDDDAMMEEFGFDHIQFIDYKALRGDTSDNVPGIDGVGEKTAANLIIQFGSIENMLSHLDEIKNEKLRNKIEAGTLQLQMSKMLVTIVKNVPVDYTIDDLIIKKENTAELIEIYKKLEFKTHLDRLLKSSAEKDNTASAEIIQKSFEFPTAKQIAASELESLLNGDVVIDIESDDSHISDPVLTSVRLLKDNNAYVYNGNDISIFKNKSFKASGYRLGRLFYLLIANGIDCDGIECGFDCSLAAYVLNPNGKTPDLENLIFEAFHINLSEEPKQLSLFDNCESDNSVYVKKLILMSELISIQKKDIEANGLSDVYFKIELPLCKVLADMEARGIRVDSVELINMGKKFKSMIASLEDEIYDLAGERFNINSTKQLGEILFDKLGLPAGKKTSRGYSTSAEILEKLADDYPVVAKILEYRSYSKLNSTYIEGLLPLIGQDGKVHAHFQQTVTATGRISCTEPNLQNIPVRQELGRQLRKLYRTQSDDYTFIGADYSQIELRIMAHMSGDKQLIDAFNSGHDIHKETASEIFGVKPENVTAQMRSNAKAVNFGVIYGMSSFGLAGELTISRKEAEKYISDYFKRFSQVKLFLDDCIKQTKDSGYALTMYGRRRAVPEINASNYMTRQLGERLAMNSPIQGSAADIIKIAMINVYKRLKSECEDSHLILQIHDELIIQANNNEKDKVYLILKEEMENAAQLSVKLEVQENSADNWYDLK